MAVKLLPSLLSRQYLLIWLMVQKMFPVAWRSANRRYWILSRLLKFNWALLSGKAYILSVVRDELTQIFPKPICHERQVAETPDDAQTSPITSEFLMNFSQPLLPVKRMTSDRWHESDWGILGIPSDQMMAIPQITVCLTAPSLLHWVYYLEVFQVWPNGSTMWDNVDK